MTVYRTGRSADYIVGPEEKQSKQPKSRPVNHTADAIDQFERMAAVFAPRCADQGGMAVVWVRDDTITEEQRAWCRDTARQIKREAELAKLQRRAQQPAARTTAEVEQAVASALSRRPDATAHEIRMITGVAHSRVLRSEAWIMAQMGKASAR